VLDDADAQLALWCLYELHYRGFEGVDERWEWSAELVDARLELESIFEAELRVLVGADERGSDELVDTVQELVGAEGHQRPPLASHLGSDASPGQFAEFLMLRSISQLKEADPPAFVLPRLPPGPKAALAELLYDKYGDGRPERVHQQLFADALQSLGLPAEYGGLIERSSTQILAESNAASLFAVNRRLRGAALGHLAAFEATSSIPNRLVANGARRLGLPAAVARYFDEHVVADAIHEQVAIREICGRLVGAEPHLVGDVLFGARTCLALATRCGAQMLDAWHAGGSALLSAEHLGDAA
jgi:hypothetical protein